MLSTARRIALYRQRGWCPVPWAHHPAPVKAALRATGIRPKLKECYQNCQRLLLSGHPIVAELVYIEGFVAGVIPVHHAWLEWRGQRLDLTVADDPLPAILADPAPRRYPVAAIQQHVLRRHTYGALTVNVINPMYRRDIEQLQQRLEQLQPRRHHPR